MPLLSLCKFMFAFISLILECILLFGVQKKIPTWDLGDFGSDLPEAYLGHIIIFQPNLSHSVINCIIYILGFFEEQQGSTSVILDISLLVLK